MTFSYSHICEPANLASRPQRRLGRVSSPSSRRPPSPSFHRSIGGSTILLLKCFTAADSDFDSKVRLEDLNGMVEVAASLPRSFRFAPSGAVLFKTSEEHDRRLIAVWENPLHTEFSIDTSQMASKCSGRFQCTQSQLSSLAVASSQTHGKRVLSTQRGTLGGEREKGFVRGDLTTRILWGAWWRCHSAEVGWASCKFLRTQDHAAAIIA